MAVGITTDITYPIFITDSLPAYLTLQPRVYDILSKLSQFNGLNVSNAESTFVTSWLICVCLI